MTDCDDPKCVLPGTHEGKCDYRPPVEVDYVNWKGQRRKRRIAPTGQFLRSASPPWHPEEQWLIGAIDCEDGKHKFFAAAGLRRWGEVGAADDEKSK